MKKLIISSSVLAPALKKLGQAVNKNSVLPVLSNILLKAAEGQVTLITTDLEITIHYRLACECKAAFEALIPFEFLSKIVAVNKNCPITIELDKSLKVMGPNDVYEVRSPEKVAKYPKLQELPKETHVVLSENILNCLHTALATTNSSNDRKPCLAFVLLELSAGKITVASADGSYVVFSRTFESANVSTEEMLLSPKVIRVLEGCDEAKVFYNEKTIGFEAGDITIINTRSEEKFVNFRKVFPPDWPGNLSIDRVELLYALGKCSISSDISRTTLLELSGEALKMHAEDGIITINVTVPCAYTGEVAKTQINSDKLMKLLHQVDYPGLDFAIHDKNRAIVITSGDDPGYQAMIMPIAFN